MVILAGQPAWDGRGRGISRCCHGLTAAGGSVHGMEDETGPAAGDAHAVGLDRTDEGNGEVPGGPGYPPGERGPEADAWPATGEPRVDAALKLLDRLPGLPVSDHPELFEQVHAQLTEVLGELDSGPGGPAGLPGN
jgi:hypothetical protein